MNKQVILSYFCDELAQTKTSKKAFLKQMEKLISWDKWIGIIKPYYCKGERGNKPYDLELILRIYIMQNLGHEKQIQKINMMFA